MFGASGPGNYDVSKIKKKIYLVQEYLVSEEFSLKFLAAMSSSRSDVVTQFVRSSVRSFVRVSVPFFSFSVFLLGLKSFNGVSRKS